MTQLIAEIGLEESKKAKFRKKHYLVKSASTNWFGAWQKQSRKKNALSNVSNCHIVQHLRCDERQECDNKKFSELLTSKGIEFCITSLYTPQPNDVAKRENRSTVECAHSMLNPSNLPQELWAETYNTANYLLNRTGECPIENKSTYELWYGRPVGSLNHFKPNATCI